MSLYTFIYYFVVTGKQRSCTGLRISAVGKSVYVQMTPKKFLLPWGMWTPTKYTCRWFLGPLSHTHTTSQWALNNRQTHRDVDNDTAVGCFLCYMCMAMRPNNV